MDPVISVQNKNFSGNTKELAKVLGAEIGSLKSFTLTIPWSLAKLVKIFPGIIETSTPHRSETNGIAERAVRRVKEGTSSVLLQQVWKKNGGQIPWNAIPICEIFKISCLMGRLHTRDVLENHFMDRSFRLVHWLNITLSLRKTSHVRFVRGVNLEG